MTTTRKSNFSAALRTTILMATLGGLLIAIGYAIGGIQIASVFLVIALVMNGVAYWFSDKIAIASARAKPLSEQEAPGIYQMVRELTTRADLPMPRLYMIPQRPAERVRDRPQPEARRGRGDQRDHQAALRGRAARGARARARPRQEPRHPDPVRGLGDRRDDHLPGVLRALVRRRRRFAGRAGREPGPGPAGADRGDA